MDVDALQAASGWRIVHHAEVGSTNDDVAAMRDQGDRIAVVADRQFHGRGREGRDFVSPPGGLYVSMLLRAAPEFVPHQMVACTAVALCEAVEACTDLHPAIKWPNDLWIGDRKAGGILLEGAGVHRPVVVGIGVNLDAVPSTLPETLRARTTSLADAGAVTSREELLQALLRAMDTWHARLGDPRLEAAWRRRLLWIGAPVTLSYAGMMREGVLEDVDLVRGLLVRDALAGPVWLDAAHVQDLTRV